MYIIPTTCIAFIVVLITTGLQLKNEEEFVQKKDTKTMKNEQKRKRRVAFFKIIQELTIIFFSAILAIWLTDVFEENKTKERVSSFMAATSNANIGQLSQVNGILLDLKEKQSVTDEDVLQIAGAPIKNWSNMTETVLYNDMVISTIDPMSYTMLNTCMENNERVVESLKEEIEKGVLNKQTIADNVASYCFYTAQLSLYLEILSDDVTFQLPLLVIVEEDVLVKELSASTSYAAYAEIYQNDINMLEQLLGVELPYWKERTLY